MKFSNGCWLQAEGIECFSPKEAYFVTIEDKIVTICAPTNKINSRGDVLGGINLTLKITSPAPEVLRMQTFHHLGALKKGPEFELEQKENVVLDVKEEDNLLIIKSGGTLALQINKETWSMAYKRGTEILTTSADKDLACMKTVE